MPSEQTAGGRSKPSVSWRTTRDLTRRARSRRSTHQPFRDHRSRWRNVLHKWRVSSRGKDVGGVAREQPLPKELPMLLLLALPILLAVVTAHHYLAIFAPSNVLIRRTRSSPPRWRDVAVLIGLVAGLLIAVHLLVDGIAAGGPGWLNIVVLVLAWDAIKFGLLALRTTGSCIASAAGRLLPRTHGSSGQPSTARANRRPSPT